MKFRTSYGQNALKAFHRGCTAVRSSGRRDRCGCPSGQSVPVLLHDIGKSIDHEMEGSHIQIGADLCRKYKESQNCHQCGGISSRRCRTAESLIACLVQAADTISAARPGARRETLETYTNQIKTA